MLKQHSNKELSKSYIMSTNPSQDDEHRMHLSGNSSPGEDVEDYDDTIVMHRPTVQKCLEKFKELKQKYVDLERAHISLQAKIKASEEVESSDETSGSEESLSEAETDEVDSERNKLGSTNLAKIVLELNRLKSMSPSNQKKFIDTCHKDLIRSIGSSTRDIINGKAKLTPDELKQLRRRKQMVRSLARKNTSLKTKRKILQSGGFLNLLLPPIVGLMTTILKKQ